MSDLCAAPHCSDLALPGGDYCAHCEADLKAEREIVAAQAARLTVENEQRAEQDDRT